MFRYIEIKDKKTATFNYISDLKITNKNIEDRVIFGRKRWKIENEGFNVQKNGTFNISHLCSRFENASTKKEISKLITNTLISSQNSDLNNLEINFQLRFDD